MQDKMDLIGFIVPLELVEVGGIAAAVLRDPNISRSMLSLSFELTRGRSDKQDRTRSSLLRSHPSLERRPS